MEASGACICIPLCFVSVESLVGRARLTMTVEYVERVDDHHCGQEGSSLIGSPSNVSQQPEFTSLSCSLLARSHHLSRALAGSMVKHRQVKLLALAAMPRESCRRVSPPSINQSPAETDAKHPVDIAGAAHH